MMTMLFLIIPFLITFVVLILLLNTRLGNFALDHPNQRSLHVSAIPRTGGIALMSGVIASWILIGGNTYWLLLIIGLITLSILDDVKNLPVRLRFFIQTIVAISYIVLFLLDQPLWLLFLLVITMVWMTNLYNFMDGSDGLAGGMALFGFGAYALIAYTAGDEKLTLLAGSIASASLAFLIFNFNPAKIFMGDGGSIPLGFLAISMGLYGWRHNIWPIWIPLVIFSPFIVDATITLFKRTLKRERIFHAHRSHYYQRLIQMGWGHKKTAIFEYILMIILGFIAMLMIEMTFFYQIMSLSIICLTYCYLMILIDTSWNKSIKNNLQH